MKEKSFRTSVLNKEITVFAADTGNGLNVTIAGGDRGHIGAVSVKYPGMELISHQFPTHREGVVSDKWAVTLSGSLNVPVCVSAGVHYDSISKEEIAEILKALDRLLDDVVSGFTAESGENV